MINNKQLFSLIFIIIGIILIISGISWMVVEQPWILDKVANEERLKMSFDELFSHEINHTLPEYLKQIYRFFGLWVIIIGCFITALSKPKMIENKNIRLILIFCVGILSYVGLILGYTWIPSSPFIYLGWGLVGLHLMSLLSHYNYK